jgi:hypothetical protein
LRQFGFCFCGGFYCVVFERGENDG